MTCAGRWFHPGTQISSINKADRRDATEIQLKAELSTLNLQAIDQRSYNTMIKRKTMVHNTLHRILKINIQTALKPALCVWKWIGVNSDAKEGVIKT